MSIPAIERVDEIKAELKLHPSLHFFLDFDGTLAPIVSTPSEAELPEEMREHLRMLSTQAQLSILSGRAIADLRARVGLEVTYAGNHGLEIEGPGLHFREPEAERVAPMLRDVSSHLRDRLKAFWGVEVEDKGLTASVHFRNAEAGQVPEIKRLVERHVNGAPFHLRGGKMVIEVRPNVEWHKGSAAKYILARTPKAFPIAIGDDETDEDLFRALLHGITIRIGSSATTARYFLEEQSELRCFLDSVFPRHSP